jgi:hypothetical protein
MVLRLIAAVSTLSAPVAAWAEARSEVLMDLLSRVPTEALESEPADWSQLIFADLVAAAGVLDPPPAGIDLEGLAKFGAYARVFGPEGLGQSVSHGMEGAWEPLIGFSPLQVEAALGFRVGDPYDYAQVVRLNEAATSRVGPALLANGFVEDAREGATAWARGAEDYEFDRAHYDMANPFGGDMGRSSRVALNGTLLVETAGWTLLGEVLGTEVPKGHPDLAAVAAALDSPNWGEAQLLQLAVLPHQLSLSTGRGGMPAWRLGMLADLGTGTETVALALFSYSSRSEAKAAAAHIATVWDAPVASTSMEVFHSQIGEPSIDLEAFSAPSLQPSFQERTGANAVVGVAGEGPFVAWVALRGVPVADGHRIRNPAFMALWIGVLDRNLAIFGPL